jgi:hypothetical protein
MKTVLHRGAWAESEPMVYTACSSDVCQQGRSPCPTPQACQVTPYDVESQAPWITACLAALTIIGTIAVCALFAMVTV